MLKNYNNDSNSNQIIHFLHGNSLTPSSYKRILDYFCDKFLIKTSLLRPLWDKSDMPKFNNWNIFLNDYIDSIRDEKDMIGIGHSIGGNLLLKASILKPKKFKKIILLDPTFLPPNMIRAWKMISLLNLQTFFLPLINLAKNKKMEYSSIDRMYNSYRKNKFFSNFSDKVLKEFVESLVFKKDEKYKLIYPSNWDSKIYKTGLSNDMFIWDNIHQLKVETLIIRAEYSNVFFKKTADLIQKRNKNIKIKTMPKVDHLFPISESSETIGLINGFI